MSDAAVIGLDPGAAGGCALITPERESIVTFGFKQYTEQEIYLILQSFTLGPCKAFMEKVGARPGQGTVSMFNFGDACGFLRGIVTASGMPFELVAPQKWQLALGLGNRKLTYSQRKTANRQLAQQWFPQLKVTNETADALLIAEYGYRLLYGR